MHWLSYFWKIIWKEAGKIIRTLYFGTMIVPGGIGLSLGLPMIEWVGLSVVATLVILLTQTINRAKALTEKMEPKLSVVLKDGEMIIEASLSAQAISTLYKIVLKNSGGEPIKRGNLIYRQLHYSKKPTRRARIEPTNKFVKQTENGALFGGKAIVPQKTYFSLNRDEEIEFDAFLLQEYRVDNRKGSPQLIYYGVAENTGLKETTYTLTEKKTYSIGFRATSDTGGAVDFIVKLKFDDINKPIKVWKV